MSHILITYCESEGIQASIHKTETGAQNALMRDVYEDYQGLELPETYEEASNFVNEYGIDLQWRILDQENMELSK